VSASTRERYFCSDTARVRQDDNAATATRVDVWILVELSATWGARPLLDAPMPPSVRATLTSAIAQIPRCRVVFIRRRFETRTGCRVYIARSAPKPWITSIDLPSIDDVAALPLRALARGEGRGQSAEGRSAGGAEGGALKAEGRAQRAERRGDPSELLPSALCPLPSDPSEPLPSAFRAAAR
jgi:hypothetical protein